jgi:hypothetical protein
MLSFRPMAAMGIAPGPGKIPAPAQLQRPAKSWFTGENE